MNNPGIQQSLGFRKRPVDLSRCDRANDNKLIVIREVGLVPMEFLIVKSAVVRTGQTRYGL